MLTQGDISLIKHFQGVDVSNFAKANGAAAAAAPTIGSGAEAVGQLRALFSHFGDTMYDPMVTQAEHALQTALLAEAEGASDELVAAAFLHDVGHLLLDEHAGNDEFLTEDKNHESIAAECVRRPASRVLTLERAPAHVPRTQGRPRVATNRAADGWRLVGGHVGGTGTSRRRSRLL